MSFAHVPVPQKAPIDELIRYLEAKIRRAERQLVLVKDELDLCLEGRDVAQKMEKMCVVARWVARRRALIEVWEFASNQVWRTQVGKDS